MHNTNEDGQTIDLNKLMLSEDERRLLLQVSRVREAIKKLYGLELLSAADMMQKISEFSKKLREENPEKYELNLLAHILGSSSLIVDENVNNKIITFVEDLVRQNCPDAPENPEK